LQLASARDDFRGEFLERHALGEGHGAHPGQRRVEGDRQVNHDHALRLVDLVMSVHGGVQLGIRIVPRGGAVEQQLGGHLREDQAGGELALAEGARCGACACQDAEADGPELQGEREHRLGAALECGGREAGPATSAGPQVRNEHRPARSVGVRAGPLAEVELELLDPWSGRVGRGDENR
jgi:hypothetical protein